MEGDLQNSSRLECSIESDDLKYFAGLSTILVATIQEVKDRISQIEFIFCSQLFPSFQSRSKIFQKSVAEARKAAEDDWRKKESSLLCQIEELQHEKNHAQEQSQQVLTSFEWEKAKVKNLEKLLFAHETEKKLLLAKIESLGKNGEAAVLRELLTQKTEEVAKGKYLEVKLQQQLDSKDQDLLTEQNKRKETTSQFVKLKKSFKELKSQYEFLLKRSCLTMENKLPDNRVKEEKGSPRHLQNQQSSPDSNNEGTPPAPEPGVKKNDISSKEKSDDDRSARSNKNSNSPSKSKSPCISSSFHVQKSPSNAKSESLTGQKRPVSCWRETRSRQEPGGADLHDDFLDTPMENARGNMNKVPKEEAQDVPNPALKGMDCNESDDETQDIHADPLSQKQRHPIPMSENKGFKYVEPVRKKAERENLKGVECRQCKKFYDAVLPNGGMNGDGGNIRCEHHDGVSRHRYKYIPPMTPEGFWNIGFDSDL